MIRKFYMFGYYCMEDITFKAPRVCSTKTRIKTLLIVLETASIELREYVPLKQGLRLGAVAQSNNFLSPRVCSTKTRIKTKIYFPKHPVGKVSESMFH